MMIFSNVVDIPKGRNYLLDHNIEGLRQSFVNVVLPLPIFAIENPKSSLLQPRTNKLLAAESISFRGNEY